MKLSEELKSFRIDRPSEWKMDEFMRKAKQLEDVLNDFVTEYCEREGTDDWPRHADEQSSDMVRSAMKLLD
jgi:hypothetical protein